jgi:predicted amidohydrolase YtcJ
MPTRQQLDAIVPDRPAQIVSQDGRTSWVNTRALRLAGITRKTPNPPHGTIVKDQRTGEPTGVLKDAAVVLVGRRVPKPTDADTESALRAAIDEAHRNGITSIQDPSGDAAELAVYADARREGDLLVRVYAALSTSGVLTQPAMTELEAIAKLYPDDPLLKAGAISISLDGPVASHSAALLEPYANETEAGEPSIGPDDLNRMIRELDARGWQVLTIANGDRSVQMALNAYEHAVRSNPLPERGRRHRVERAQTIDAADMPRFGALGVIASMQPFDGAPTSRQLDAWLKNVGPERSGRAWPYGGVVAGAGRLAFGSGWPAAALNPMLGLHTAVNRTTADNLPEGGWDAGEHLALKMAIDAYTSGAAWASFDEQRKGSLAPGMLADLVVLSDNIFDAPTSRLASTRVAVTIFDGKVVYQRDGKQTNTN